MVPEEQEESSQSLSIDLWGQQRARAEEDEIQIDWTAAYINNHLIILIRFYNM